MLEIPSSRWKQKSLKMGIITLGIVTHKNPNIIDIFRYANQLLYPNNLSPRQRPRLSAHNLHLVSISSSRIQKEKNHIPPPPYKPKNKPPYRPNNKAPDASPDKAAPRTSHSTDKQQVSSRYCGAGMSPRQTSMAIPMLVPRGP